MVAADEDVLPSPHRRRQTQAGGADAEHGEQPPPAEQGADVEAQALVDEFLRGRGSARPR